MSIAETRAAHQVTAFDRDTDIVAAYLRAKGPSRQFVIAKETGITRTRVNEVVRDRLRFIALEDRCIALADSECDASQCDAPPSVDLSPADRIAALLKAIGPTTAMRIAAVCGMQFDEAVDEMDRDGRFAVIGNGRLYSLRDLPVHHAGTDDELRALVRERLQARAFWKPALMAHDLAIEPARLERILLESDEFQKTPEGWRLTPLPEIPGDETDEQE